MLRTTRDAGYSRAASKLTFRRDQGSVRWPSLTHDWNEFWNYFHQGLPHINILLGIVIALVGGMMVGSVLGLFVTALLAVVVHVLVEALIPVVQNHATFVLPTFNSGFIHYAISLYIAYFVVIGAIFAVRLLFASARPTHSEI